jgi:hypothetical protein
MIDRSLENRQHRNKPDFTRVPLPFSDGNTAATAGNMLPLDKNLTADCTDFTDAWQDYGKPGLPRNTRTTRTPKAKKATLIDRKIGNTVTNVDNQRLSW